MTEETKDYLNRRLKECYNNPDLDVYDLLSLIQTLLDEL